MQRATESSPRSPGAAAPWCERLAANISMLFTEQDFVDRFAAAADAGFRAVEMQYPYAEPAARLARAAEQSGVAVVLCNAPLGDPARGDRGIACLPGREQDFRASVMRALDYAGAMRCPRIHVLSGIPAPGDTRATALARAAENLAWAAQAATPFGTEILVEPLNAQDLPGYLLPDVDAVAALLALCGRGDPRPRLLFDAYHCAMAQQDIVEALQRHVPLIAHVQIADAPGRAEPGTGRIDWQRVFEALASAGYDGWIGCEYRPRADTRQGLGWRDLLDRCRTPADSFESTQVQGLRRGGAR